MARKKSIVNAQAEHAVRLAKLILYANKKGYIVTGGDWMRDERCPYGYPNSLHKRRLATDLNLFKVVGNRKYYLQKTEQYKFLGDYWESLKGDLAQYSVPRWGGHFDDGNHFESRPI